MTEAAAINLHALASAYSKMPHEVAAQAGPDLAFDAYIFRKANEALAPGGKE